VAFLFVSFFSVIFGSLRSKLRCRISRLGFLKSSYATMAKEKAENDFAE